MTRRARLLVYTDGTSRGGAEIVLRNLLAGLPDRFEVTILGVHGDVTEWIARARPDARAEILPPVRNKTDVPGILRHRAAIVRRRPDLFQANLTSLPSCQYALLAAASIDGLPLIAVEHSLWASPTALSRRLKRWTSGRLAAHVAVGSLVAREIEQLVGLPTGSMRVIHNGVAAATAPRRLDLAAPVVCAVGRLDRLKGFDLLVEVVARMKEGSLLLIGDGPERQNLEALAVERGVAHRVRLTGWSDEAAALLAGSDIFVLPSRLESLPLSLLEAMHAGIPVVVTPVGSIPEAVQHGVTGLIVPVGDADALRAAIELLVDDPPRRRMLGASGRAWAREAFSVERMVDAYVALYDELLA